MKVAGVAVVLLLAACNSSSAPSAQSTASPRTSPTVTANATPGPSPSPSLQAASCDLPVWVGGHGGFLQYPGGAFTADPASTMLTEPGGQTTEVKPQLHGAGGETYDRQLGRWLPVDASQVSRDGVSYAYFDVLSNNPSLTVVDVASGNTRVEFSGDRRFIWAVVSFRPEGIYVSHSGGPAGQDPNPNRLWRVDPSGTLTAISDRSTVGFWRMAGGYAWEVETDDPSKLNQPGNEVRLLRVDVTTGAATNWFRRTGTLVEPLGVEPDGSALVLVSDPLALWQVAGPGVERQVASMGAAINTLSDSHGVWLSDNGIWLAAPNGEVLAVGQLSGTPAGECA